MKRSAFHPLRRPDGRDPHHVSQITPSSRTAREALYSLARFARDALAVTGLLSIIYHLCFNLSVVVSGSMAPTLQGGGSAESDWMLSERVSYWFRDPRRWEVVQFVTGDQMIVAKRIVGLPGETIALRDHRVAVNNALLPAPSSLASLRYYPLGNLSDGRARTCGAGYFLLGDDSRDSWDSRFDGPVNRSAIRGRVWLVVWPLSRLGFVNDGRQ